MESVFIHLLFYSAFWVLNSSSDLISYRTVDEKEATVLTEVNKHDTICVEENVVSDQVIITQDCDSFCVHWVYIWLSLYLNWILNCKDETDLLKNCTQFLDKGDNW